jgi:hypothetical protein
MPEDRSREDPRLVALQRDEALHTIAALRREMTTVLQEHRASELHLAETVRRLQGDLMQARDTISHMERSAFWRARQWWVRLRGRR